MSLYQIYPTGLPITNPTLYTDNGSYGWSKIMEITDRQMPIHSWTLEEHVGRVLAKFKNYINRHNIGDSSNVIGTGYYTQLGYSGGDNWYGADGSGGINILYVKNFYILNKSHTENANAASYGNISNYLLLKSSATAGASSYLNKIELPSLNSTIDSWNSGNFSHNNPGFNRTNARGHTHANILTLAGISGALGYILPERGDGNEHINLRELNIQSGRIEFDRNAEILVNSGLYIYQSGNFYVPESNFNLEISPKHRHDGISGKYLLSTSIGTLSTLNYSGTYNNFSIYNRGYNQSGIIKGSFISHTGIWNEVLTFDQTAPSIYSFKNKLILSRDYIIYKSTNLGTSWTNVYESPTKVTHNSIVNPSKNQNKFRIYDGNLFLGRSGEIVSSNDLITWNTKNILTSGIQDGILVKSLLNYSIENKGTMYYSGGNWVSDDTPNSYSVFEFKNKKIDVPESYNVISYKNNVYYTTSGKLYEYEDDNLTIPNVIYDTGYSSITGGPIKIYNDKIYFAVGSGLYSYWNNTIKLEKTTDSLINDIHVFSGYLFVACATELYKTKSLVL